MSEPPAMKRKRVSFKERRVDTELLAAEARAEAAHKISAARVSVTRARVSSALSSAKEEQAKEFMDKVVEKYSETPILRIPSTPASAVIATISSSSLNKVNRRQVEELLAEDEEKVKLPFAP